MKPMKCLTSSPSSSVPRFNWMLIALLTLWFAPTVDAQDVDSKVPLYDNLGDYHYEISTSVPAAQQYFDQGVRLYYAFNHAEAIRAFNEAARLDPECAICHWGTALSWGPNINLPMDSASGVAAFESLQMAKTAYDHASPSEKALIDALSFRYAPVPPKERAGLDTAYTIAMKGVVTSYPDNLEARTLYAESLMDLSPWEYWDKDGSPRPDTPELLENLERVLSLSPHHPGANHFYIHAVEAVDPERAVSAAENLAGLMPGAGHLVHMPGHIYVRVGRYLDAIMANEHAVHADETYIADQNPAFGVYVAGYYPHNYDFMAFAASMIGRSHQAISAAEKMATLSPDELLWEPGMAFLQHHRTRHLQMKIRFHRWDAILDVPAPPEGLPHATAMWHYAQGRALASKGDLTQAKVHLALLRSASEDPGLRNLRLEFNTSGRLLAIAAKVLAGTIAGAEGDLEHAIVDLDAASVLEDGLVYGEPPDWTVPVRQELGMILLEAGKPVEAEKTFREDLDRFPENGWSLHGLEHALRMQMRVDEATEVEARFEKIWASADVEL